MSFRELLIAITALSGGLASHAANAHDSPPGHAVANPKFHMVWQGETVQNPSGIVYNTSQIAEDHYLAVCRVSGNNGAVIHFRPSTGSHPNFEQSPNKDWRADFQGVLQVNTCVFVDANTDFIILDGDGKAGVPLIAAEVTVTPFLLIPPPPP